jgi:hypothetical protein
VVVAGGTVHPECFIDCVVVQLLDVGFMVRHDTKKSVMVLVVHSLLELWLPLGIDVGIPPVGGPVPGGKQRKAGPITHGIHIGIGGTTQGIRWSVSLEVGLVGCEPGGVVVGGWVIDEGLLIVDVVPETVVRDPLGSVEVDGGIVVTEGDCEPLDTVSVVPETVVRDPLGSVEVVGWIVVTEKLGELLFVELKIDVEGENVNVSPSVVRVVGPVT